MTPRLPSIDGIPDFLRITPEDRKAAWKGRKLTVQGSGFRRIDKKEDALRKRLQREYDELQAAKRAERLKALRERFS
jgi:hypothetical protein